VEYRDINFMDGHTLRASRAEGADNLRIEVEGDRCIMDAVIRRAFPLSKPTEFLSIQESGGKEVGVLKSLDELDNESRKLVEHELDRRYFTPEILQLRALKQEGGMWTFDVVTSRGATQFFVRNWRDSSHEVSPGRFVIQSVDGQRFEVPNFDALDTRSQALIEQLF
jgi:hypothetical protein